MRTEGGQGLYSNQQIDRFRLLAAATRRGRNISLVAGLPNDELARLVAEDEAETPAPPHEPDGRSHAERVEAALEHTRALDGSALDRELCQTIARYGIPVFLDDIVPTFMHRVGEEWQAGRLTVAQEHLASAAVLAIILRRVLAREAQVG